MDLGPPRTSRLGGAYVVLLEDDAATADMYALGLTAAGYNVATFPDPASFFKALDVRVPDLVVVDWTLPGMTGGDVLRALHEEIWTLSLRVVVLSNIAVRDREMKLALDAGALAWYEKTRTTPQQLAASIQSLLTGSVARSGAGA